jgi:hypothetical protein
MRALTKAEIALRDKLLADSGFLDIEKPDGSLYAENPNHENASVSLGDHHAPAEWQSQHSYIYDHLSAAIQRYPFKNDTDRAICEKLASGAFILDVIRACRTSQRRVYRVMKAVRAWADPDDLREGETEADREAETAAGWARLAGYRH